MRREAAPHHLSSGSRPFHTPTAGSPEVEREERMRATKLFYLILTALFLSGCVPIMSVHPLFLKKDFVFDARLLGEWQDQDGKPFCRFEKSDDGYNMYFLGKDGQPVNKYDAHLASLRGSLFLDILLKEAMPDEVFERSFPLFLVPAHTFYQVRFEGESLEYRFLDDEAIESMRKQKKLNLAHARVDDLTVLTAPTDKLQKFVLKNLKTEKAFSSWEEGKLHHPSPTSP
jgi:hypothetical protein